MWLWGAMELQNLEMTFFLFACVLGCSESNLQLNTVCACMCVCMHVCAGSCLSFRLITGQVDGTGCSPLEMWHSAPKTRRIAPCDYGSCRHARRRQHNSQLLEGEICLCTGHCFSYVDQLRTRLCEKSIIYCNSSINYLLMVYPNWNGAQYFWDR